MLAVWREKVFLGNRIVLLGINSLNWRVKRILREIWTKEKDQKENLVKRGFKNVIKNFNLKGKVIKITKIIKFANKMKIFAKISTQILKI